MSKAGSVGDLLRRRLREPRALLRQLVVGETLAEPPRRGLVPGPPPPPPRNKAK